MRRLIRLPGNGYFLQAKERLGMSNLLVKFALIVTTFVPFVRFKQCDAMKQGFTEANDLLNLSFRKISPCSCNGFCKNLSQAISKNCPACCLKSIVAKEDPNASDPKNSLPFIHCAINLQRTDILWLLLEHHADPCARDYSNRKPLFYVQNKNILEALLLYGGDQVDSEDDSGPYGSGLMDLIDRKNVEMVKLFLICGADLLEIDENNQNNVLHYAIKNTDPSMIAFFLEWPCVLVGAKKSSFDQIKLLCKNISTCNTAVCYLLLLFKKVGQKLALKVPKLVQIMLLECCMSSYLKKLWKSPYAQRILINDNSLQEVASIKNELKNHKNALQQTPLDLVSKDLTVNLQHQSLLVYDESDEESLEMARYMEKKDQDLKKIQEILENNK